MASARYEFVVTQELVNIVNVFHAVRNTVTALFHCSLRRPWGQERHSVPTHHDAIFCLNTLKSARNDHEDLPERLARALLEAVRGNPLTGFLIIHQGMPDE